MMRHRICSSFRGSLVVTSGVLALMCAAPAHAGSLFGCRNLENDPTLPMVEGKQGFFFRIQADLRMQHPMTEAMIGQLAEISAALKKNGTTLVYVPIPTKSQVMPELLPDSAKLYGLDVKVAQDVYSDLVRRLQQRGIATVDLMTAMQSSDAKDPPFFGTDFHWTSRGAREAAQAVAEIVKRDEAYKDLTPSRFETTDLGPATAFSSMRRIIQRYCVDSVPLAVTNAYETRQAESANAGLDIFGGGGADDIALVGTSFSDAEHQNFGGFLSEFTGLSVANRSITGGNQFGSITSYMTSASFAESRPKFLIWENPIYNNLATFGDGVISELIAAAANDCRPMPAAAVTLMDPNTLSVDLTNSGLKVRDVVYAYAGDDTSRKTTLQMHGKDGEVLERSLERSARIETSGRFYLSVEPLWKSDLRSMTVKFDRLVPDSAQVGICNLGRG